MTWRTIYRGSGVPSGAALPEPPPWRTFPVPPQAETFQPPDGLIDAVNASIFLRRPLLLTGAPGSGKSSVIQSVAAELELGSVLRWHITSRSTLTDALYRYDVLGRIHAYQLAKATGADASDDIAPFLQLGPLGHALLPDARPRALLVDEIDKSDLDLPSDLLDVLDRGEFRIPELERYAADDVTIRGADGASTHTVVRGLVQCTEFPVVVLTSNGEREFPSAFLRRCIRFTMPVPTVASVTRVVEAHLGQALATNPIAVELIERFVERVMGRESLAVDQLLNAVFLLGDGGVVDDATRGRLEGLLLRELSRA
jgi:MoxR-like ATPase